MLIPKVQIKKPKYKISGMVTATSEGYFKNEIHKEGRTFQYEGFGTRLPMWVIAVDKKKIVCEEIVYPKDAKKEEIIADDYTPKNSKDKSSDSNLV
jgi:hypothetical protein